MAMVSLAKASGCGMIFGFGFVKLNGIYSVTFLFNCSPS
jgi:hypothetical protein